MEVVYSPIGSFTLDKSQRESVFRSCSHTPAGRFWRGMSAAIESMCCVGAASRALGASAKMRLSGAVKSILSGRLGGEDGLLCCVMVFVYVCNRRSSEAATVNPKVIYRDCPRIGNRTKRTA